MVCNHFCLCIACNKAHTAVEYAACNLSVLTHLGYYNKNTIHWVAYKQQQFISYHSGGWDVQDHGVADFGVWWESRSHKWPSSWCVLTWQKGSRDLTGLSFIRPLLLLMKVHDWMPHLLISSHWELDFSMWILGRGGGRQTFFSLQSIIQVIGKCSIS